MSDPLSPDPARPASPPAPERPGKAPNKGRQKPETGGDRQTQPSTSHSRHQRTRHRQEFFGAK